MQEVLENVSNIGLDCLQSSFDRALSVGGLTADSKISCSGLACTTPLTCLLIGLPPFGLRKWRQET